MSPMPAAKLGWLRRILGKLAGESGRVFAALGLLLVAAPLLMCWLQGRPVLEQALAWTFFALLFGLVAWPLLGRIFGPVFFYDVIRQGRKGRYVFFRCLYACTLVALLFAICFESGDVATISRADQRALSRFAERFFFVFMCGQLLAIGVLTPAYVAGAVAEERENNTLEYLFACGLGNADIVVGKLISRFANLAILILAGLPIISLIPLWGGVDPQLVLAGFLASVMTMLSLTCLSILFSVFSCQARRAILFTYLTAALYGGVTFLIPALVRWRSVASILLGWVPEPSTFANVLHYLGSGNIVLSLRELQAGWQSGFTINDVLPIIVLRYVLFHALLAVACVALAIACLRRVAMAQRSVPGESLPPRLRRFRPALGEQPPMLWKETLTTHLLSVDWVGQRMIALFYLASFAPLFWLWAHYLTGSYERPAGEWLILQESVGTWARRIAIWLACVGLVVVAAHAAGSVGGERDRRTWDSLLGTSLTAGDILFAKWMGSILSARWMGVWLLVVWLVGVAHGAMYQPLSSLLAFAWVGYAAFLASLGLYCSVRCRTTLLAMLWTLGIACGIAFVPWIHWLTLGFATRTAGAYWMSHVLNLEVYGLAPPVAFSWITSPEIRVMNDVFEEAKLPARPVQGIAEGLVVYAVLSALFYRLAVARMTRLTNWHAPEQAVRAPAWSMPRPRPA